MTDKQLQLTAFVSSLGLASGVLIPRAAEGGFASASLWWGVATGILLALGAVAFGKWRKREHTKADA